MLVSLSPHLQSSRCTLFSAGAFTINASTVLPLLQSPTLIDASRYISIQWHYFLKLSAWALTVHTLHLHSTFIAAQTCFHEPLRSLEQATCVSRVFSLCKLPALSAIRLRSVCGLRHFDLRRLAPSEPQSHTPAIFFSCNRRRSLYVYLCVIVRHC